MYEAAVVGAAGFLGSAVIEAFNAADAAVTGFTLDRPLVDGGQLHPDARGVRTLVWCASRINPRLAIEEPALIEADKRDLDEAIALYAQEARPPRIITFSSGGTLYGPPSVPPFAETDEPHPVNSYGEAKLEIEQHVARSGIESIALRVANAYGPGQRPAPGQGVLAHWIEAALNGAEVHVYGDPTATRDYVYVDDIAAAVLASHRAETVPPVVNIGSGVATSLNDLLHILEPIVAPRVLRVVRHHARDTDTAHSTLDASLAREALGWQAQVPLADGIARQWHWRAAQ